MESSDRNSTISVRQADENDVAVHVIGAGPVGLLLTALLQSMEGFSVRLFCNNRKDHADGVVGTEQPLFALEDNDAQRIGII